jgi:hypothetical protein
MDEIRMKILGKMKFMYEIHHAQCSSMLCMHDMHTKLRIGVNSCIKKPFKVQLDWIFKKFTPG